MVTGGLSHEFTTAEAAYSSMGPDHTLYYSGLHGLWALRVTQHCVPQDCPLHPSPNPK